ncbi:GAF domain-containing protein [Tahibacter sp. BL]|uniref:GAF domain-containing protein n=2 Tax=Tahibacter soli TaxID=2983605 RepID=A0A9X3YLP8_9GAMM|nr:GAF domain-containing protein [Tahibacter soli]MDC8013540.1 GAF domain-containing protein [Tahibacter soli]
MMAKPLEETTRQRVLDTYRVVDSLPEAAYDDIVALASILCDTPIALVSLVDRDRQWFKASRGLDATGTRRDEAFCNHAIDAPAQLMEVADAREDARFAENPLVTGDLSLRFYAGMPLVTEEGAAIGTVCVLDRKPRALDAAQRTGLSALARLTMTLLDARLRQQESERAAIFAEVEASHAEAPERDDLAQAGGGYAVAIFQVQDLAGHALKLGERTIERRLQDLERELHDALEPGSGDSVNRTSHSSDFIAVLHGDDTRGKERTLRDRVDAFAARHGMAFVAASAAAYGGAERIERVFLRADDELTRIKSEPAALGL